MAAPCTLCPRRPAATVLLHRQPGNAGHLVKVDSLTPVLLLSRDESREDLLVRMRVVALGATGV
ncbi:hypothetical protein ACWGJT_04055 [Streptomyces xantholiticus]